MNDLINMHGIKQYQNNLDFWFGHLLYFVLCIIFIAYKNKILCYLYCCTVHLVDSLIITQPTNARIVCHLFLNHFFKTLSLLLHVSIAYRLSSSGSTYSS